MRVGTTRLADIRHTNDQRLMDWAARALRDLLESIVRGPVPERWTDLLNRLNAKENARNRAISDGRDSRWPTLSYR